MKSDEPAWYSVGDGRLRLWDGAQWTDRYRLADAPMRQTPKRQTVGPPTPKRQKATQRDTPVHRDDERLDTLLATRHGSRFVTWAMLVAAAVVATVVGVSYFTG